MYREMQEILATEGGVLVTAYANHVDAASTALGHGPNVDGNWGMDSARLMERWWFSDPSA